ncbi:MAG: DUF1566 domain-containing protein [FCB group bacterium]|nr:DUF1566 domain-containing protein [FCB group bacterium]
MNIKKTNTTVLAAILIVGSIAGQSATSNSPQVSLSQGYSIVKTGQTTCYDENVPITCPSTGQPFLGQDACFAGNEPSYQNNGDSTITDNVTGLMWQKSADMDGDGDIDASDKMTYDEAVAGAETYNLAGYDDWRLPTIKEVYSLIMFYGAEPNPEATSPGTAVPYIDTSYFDFGWGDVGAGERIIDAQYASSTIYVSTTMGGNRTMFGVNFADGRIKGYPADMIDLYVMYVRGNTAYGINDFIDNGDSTIIDNATGLMWMKYDNGAGLLWEDALSYAEGSEYAGYTDWRLPNAKELQSIVDYTRSPATTGSAAIDPIFDCTPITNEAGETDYPFYWSGTTFCSQSPTNGASAAYISFGRAMGYMSQFGGWIDVHGAGAQRSDPKIGDPEDYPTGHGPQGDAIRIYNYVRCVRDISVSQSSCGNANGDGAINVGDAVFLIDYIFKSGDAPDPLCIGDANGDDAVNVGDPVYLINYIFKAGPRPVETCCL